MAEESIPNPEPVQTGTRCVVWVRTGCSVPTDLLGALSKRGVSTVVVVEPAGVMVELARQATGALIVVEPGSQPHLKALVQAVTTYHPKTARWCYQTRQPSGKAQLSKLNGQAPEGDTHLAPPEAQTHPGTAPADKAQPASPLGQVHSQGSSERIRSLIVKVNAPEGIGEPLITEEELAMLLGPIPEDLGEEH